MRLTWGRVGSLLLVAAVLVVIGAGALMARGSRADADAAAVAICTDALDDAREYDPGASLVRSELSTAAVTASWQERRYAPEITGLVSPLRSRLASEPVAICLYSGTFNTPTPASKQHDVLRLLVVGNERPFFDSAGYAGRMDPETPSDWLADRADKT